MTELTGHILTPEGWLDGRLAVGDDGRIAAIEGRAVDEAQVRTSGAPLFLPGFIDLHVHGGGGRDTMEGGDAVATLARLHARHGSTSLLATTMTAPPADIRQAFEGLAPLCRQRPMPVAPGCWACIWKAPSSTPASSGPSPTRPARPAWTWCVS